MKPLEAWANISKRLAEYAREHGYTEDDIAAEVVAFQVLQLADENEKKHHGGKEK